MVSCISCVDASFSNLHKAIGYLSKFGGFFFHFYVNLFNMISKVYRNALVIIVVILVFTGGALFLTLNSLRVTNATGVVVKFTSNGQQSWGLRTDFRIFRPFAPKTLQFTNFENIPQYEGQRIHLQYETVDVIGTDDFDVYVRPVRIDRL